MNQPAEAFAEKLEQWARLYASLMMRIDGYRVWVAMLVFGIGVALVAPICPPFMMRGLLLGWLCFFLVALLWIAFRYRFNRQHIQSIRALERLEPELGSAPSSAYDFKNLEEIPAFSSSLAEAHIFVTAQNIQVDESVVKLRQKKKYVLRNLRYTCFFLSLGWLALCSRPSVYRPVLAMFQGQIVTLYTQSPVIRGLHFVIQPPAYTQIGPTELANSDGYLELLRGSRLSIQASPVRSVRAARLRFLESDTALKSYRLAVDKNKIDGQIDLNLPASMLGEHSYVIETQDPWGRWWAGPAPYTMSILPDSKPRVRLIEPSATVELNDSDAIALSWVIDDDFGIDDVFLVVEDQQQNEIQRILLSENVGRSHHEDAQKVLAPQLGLLAGQGGTIYLEALDNNSYDGPGIGQSQRREMKVHNARTLHERTVEKYRAALHLLVDWLAMELVAPELSAIPTVRSMEYETRTLKHIESTLRFLSTVDRERRLDPITHIPLQSAFQNIEQRIQVQLKKREQAYDAWRSDSLVAPFKEQRKAAIKMLENDIVYIDDLLAVDRIESTQREAKTLSDDRYEMLRRLSDYKQAGDEQSRRALLDAVKALSEKMQRVLSRLAEAQQSLPGEYRNRESGRVSTLNDQIKEIENSLLNGDLNAAIQRIEELSAMIDTFSERTKSMRKNYGEDRYQQEREMIQKFENRFEAIAQKQKEISEELERLQNQRLEEKQRQMGISSEGLKKVLLEKIESALQAAKSILSQNTDRILQRSLTPLRAQILDLQTLVLASDFAYAYEIAQETSRMARVFIREPERMKRRLGPDSNVLDLTESANTIDERIREVEELLERLFSIANTAPSEQQRQALSDLKANQKNNEEELQSIRELMQNLNERMPVFDDNAFGKIKETQKQMQNTQQRLSQQKLRTAHESARTASEMLERLRQGMTGQASSGQGNPSPAEGSRMPLPFQPGAGATQNSGGQANEGREPMRLPAQIQDNRLLRREILDASKNPAPSGYEQSTKKYYQEITP